jgi:hypothetical protein
MLALNPQGMNRLDSTRLAFPDTAVFANKINLPAAGKQLWHV